jgi:hypothetical protein
VSEYRGQCPSCGAEIVFRLGSSLLKVCDHCGCAVARKGVDLESYGRVAALIPTASLLKLGARGGYRGAPPFTLGGHLQLDYGEGTWDEWHMVFDNEASAWLSESQGKFHYLTEAPLPPVARFEDLAAGQTVDLGPAGTFVVAEVREAQFVTAEGELPFDIAPGRSLHYADLSGPHGQFGTLDYGTGSEAEALYVGREVAFGDLGFKDLPSEEDRRKTVQTQSLSCTQCGAPLELRAPDRTQRVACPYCGSLLDATKGFAVLATLGKAEVEPLIPLGSEGRLRGVAWQVIGFVVRSVTIEDIRYPWCEYLLYQPREGFRWLVESSGHWSFVESIGAGDIAAESGGQRYDGRLFKHFQTAVASVDHVIGEFYWAVAKGDLVEAADYVDPPRMLSSERELLQPPPGEPDEAEAKRRPKGKAAKNRAQPVAESEITWSLGSYVEPDEIWKAFALQGSPPPRAGVGAIQPSPYAAGVRGIWSLTALALAALLFIFIATLATGRSYVFSDTIEIPASAVSGAPEAATFSGPIVMPSESNVEIEARANVDNSWLYLDGALINEDTGALDEFDLEVSYYHGSDSDGAWSEGAHSARSTVAAVPAGRYTLRLSPQWEANHRPTRYEITLRRRVPSFWHLVLVALALLAWPVLASMRQSGFESRRWSESDHPWGGSSE